MPTVIVMAAQAPFQQSFALLSTFIDRCPEEIWMETSGGWPVWQQVGHALSGLCFFAGAEPQGAPCAAEVLRLAAQGERPVDKVSMQAFAGRCKSAADTYINSLRDAMLTEKNAQVSAALGSPVSHAATLGMLASHTLYHLGSCDAALRNKGVPGVF